MIPPGRVRFKTRLATALAGSVQSRPITDLVKLAESMGGVAVASSSVEKSTTSLDSKFASIERRYNDQVSLRATNFVAQRY